MDVFVGSTEPGDIPGPDLVGASREQFRLFVLRVLPLNSSLARSVLRGKKSIHRSRMAEVALVFVEQPRANRGGGVVNEAIRVEQVEDLDALLVAQCPCRTWRSWAGAMLARSGPSIAGASRNVEGFARGLHADRSRQVGERLAQSSSSNAGGSSSVTPRTSESFFWTSMIFSACSSFFWTRAS